MSWQDAIKHSVTTAQGLRDYLPMSDEEAAKLQRIIDEYPMAVTQYYLSLIDRDDPDDPVRRMCVPSVSEFAAGGSFDTSGEAQNTKAEGLQHKYSQTALVLSTNVCAMYCRHCFRKRLVGLTADEISKQLADALDYIRAHPEIDNVLVSGGDSFMLSNEVLRRYLEALSGIEHIKLIRFGTRTPVVLPERIYGDPGLLALLSEYGRRVKLYVVTQFNHPNELTPQARAAIDALLSHGVVVSNQTVLLRSVNDSPDTLVRLMSGLTQFGVVPYYLFQCRPVTGVCGQFQVPIAEGYRISEAAKARLNGHAKRFRYAMSHVTGKIEILGPVHEGKEMLFKYHQAKSPANQGRIFAYPLSPIDCWLPETLDLSGKTGV